MRIALVCHLRFPIAEPFKGGMEAHTHRLAKGLVDRGHDVTLFASGDSDPRFEIDPIIPRHYETTYPWARYRSAPVLYDYLDRVTAAACDRVFDGSFDVVHNNGLHRFVLDRAVTTGRAVVTSLHVPPFDPLHGSVLAAGAPNHRYTVVSHDQVGQWWPPGKPFEPDVVYNGIDRRAWPFSDGSGAHALWCGRITPNKGTHLAVMAAKRAGVPLRIFGFVEEQDYFDETISPYLDETITYGGLLENDALRREMQAAAVLLFTPCWNEPFGLVLIEAMSCGTPVAAFDRGAAREIVDADSGVLARDGNVEELASAIRQAMTLPRSGPARRVEAMFTNDHMLAAYERQYEMAIAASRAVRGS